MSFFVLFEFGTGFRFSRLRGMGTRDDALPSWQDSEMSPPPVSAEDEPAFAGLRQTENFSVLWLNEERTLT